MSALSDGPHVNIVPKQAKAKRKPEPTPAVAVVPLERPTAVAPTLTLTDPVFASPAGEPTVESQSIETITEPVVIGEYFKSDMPIVMWY